MAARQQQARCQALQQGSRSTDRTGPQALPMAQHPRPQQPVGGRPRQGAQALQGLGVRLSSGFEAGTQPETASAR